MLSLTSYSEYDNVTEIRTGHDAVYLRLRETFMIICWHRFLLRLRCCCRCCCSSCWIASLPRRKGLPKASGLNTAPVLVMKALVSNDYLTHFHSTWM